MSARILLGYTQEGTGHTTSDDFESLTYILVWMCVLYAGPHTLRKDKEIRRTVLRSWVMVSSDSDALSLGAQKVGLRLQPSIVTDEFTKFFKPLSPIVGRLFTQLGPQPSTTDHKGNFKAIRDILLEGFGTVKEEPNWSDIKDIYGYGLLQPGTKRKAPSYATERHEEELPRAAHRLHT